MTTSPKRVYVLGTDSAVCEMFRNLGLRVLSSPEYADIVCFTGGGDISPELYGQKAIPKTYGVNNTRDTTEVSFYHGLNKPIAKIGICRGGQLLNVLNGGSMFQDVTNHRTGLHRTWIKENYAPQKHKSYYLNSYHHQMMIPAFDNPFMEIIGLADRSDERTTDKGTDTTRAHFEKNPDYEILYYSDTQSLCYQPHPEYKGSNLDTLEIFEHICKKLNLI